MSAQMRAMVALAGLLGALAVAIAWVVGWLTGGDGWLAGCIIVVALALNFVVADRRAVREMRR